MKFIKKTSGGFTVLEFLVVLAIIIILISIALPSLERARVKSHNEKMVTDVKTMVLGIEQFKQVCGRYPKLDDVDEVCNDDNENITVREFIPMIGDYQKSFNEEEQGTLYYYRFGTNGVCHGFHLGIRLEDSGDQVYAFSGDENERSDLEGFEACGENAQGTAFDGSVGNIFDIMRK